jgi:hypothetical protein
VAEITLRAAGCVMMYLIANARHSDDTNAGTTMHHQTNSWNIDLG